MTRLNIPWGRFLPDEFTPEAVISIVFHPLWTPAPAGVLILWLAGVQLKLAILWIGLCAVVVIVPLAVYIAVMKAIWGQETSVRENRHQLYMLGIGLTVLLLGALHYFQAPEILLTSIYSGALSGIIGFMLNVLDKVSLHAGVSTGISVVLFTIDPIIGVCAGLLTLTIAWARYRMQHHSVVELAIGVIIPTNCIVFVFFFFNIPLW